jgi:pentose-5-phosphate-3-epimerase
LVYRRCSVGWLLTGGVSVQADGGVRIDNLPAVRDAGANLLVSGSGVF